MALKQLIDAIKSKKILITVRDSNEDELIKFYTGGQDALTTTLLNRVVTVINIENQTSITVDLAPAE